MRRAPRDTPAGALILDKPEGPTSHDMVSLARRLLRTREIGHAGTLDPMATGVLVLCIGRATRLAGFLAAGDKVYRGRLRLGWETDTLDRTGVPLGEPRPVHCGTGEIEAAMAALTGRRMQTPPAFSAKRVRGVRAHRLARSGSSAALKPVEVVVEEFAALDVAGEEVTFEVRCGPGTYVRSLARELGEALGCGAHLVALRRTSSGECGLARAVTPERLAEKAREGNRWADLIPAGELGMGMPAVTVLPGALGRLAHGRPLQVGDWTGDPPAGEALCRVLDPAGSLVAVAQVDGGAGPTSLSPRRVLVRPSECP